MKSLNDNTVEQVATENNSSSKTNSIDYSSLQSEFESESVISNSAFTTEELIQNFLFGIDLSDSKGNPFPKALIISYINSAIAYAESLFDICLSRQEVEAEPHDYERSDYTNWGYVQLWKRPILEVKALRLMYGTRPAWEVPQDWLKIDKNSGKIQMFPSSGSVTSMIIGASGAIYGLYNSWDYAPQMWEVDYVAGMDANNLPAHLKELIYKKAVIGILQVWGDLILGAGIASSSISIDGLSQSIGTTQSAMFGGASARCEEYRKDIEALIPVLRQKYGGIRMTVV
ncbi:MAG: hypothetical protein IKB64_03010 [Paludibacteraceae bacterium]|nr:hypothetical protein [Paludibacteraceae bacterium]